MKKIVIAIIGASFSGTAVALHLVSKSKFPLDIYLIDPFPYIPKGTAFSTNNPLHPLNVRACHMSLFPQYPDHFFNWLKTKEPIWRLKEPDFASVLINRNEYAPRQLYGFYLEDCVKETLEIAKKKEMNVSLINQSALDITDSLTVVLKDNKSLHCDFIVLATGIPPSRRLSIAVNDDRYIGNLWDPPAGCFLKQGFHSNQEYQTVVIIGSGLTMVDAVISLNRLGYPGHIVAISPSGMLPEVHKEQIFAYHPDQNIQLDSPSLLELVKEFRAKIKTTGVDWRTAIDMIRSSIPKLWHKLTIEDKKRFMRHVFPFWNRHRHRMSPKSKILLDSLFEKEQLQIVAGKVVGIDSSNPSYLRVQVCLAKDQMTQFWDVEYVLNCTGPDYKIEKQNNQLLNNLQKKGMIGWDALDMGLETTPQGDLKGNAPGKIYALGSLLFGERLETTSVPEISQQAADIADNILTHLTQKEWHLD